ncbi:Multidrug resistance protein ABC transporter family [Tripterygium wilfordii]|uniref:ABC-type xenobiotic transporter n=1 Tax=Tripterygium wilfordii TaxID=458696 RepID=A0A7J7CCW9_TRIWF|nr:Multidrug resistance protein ABC transporter family [Tripterygium wilfordii]
MAIQLGFLGILLIQFVSRLLRQIFKFQVKGTEHGTDEYPIGIKFGFSYKATLVSSTVLLGTHCLMLLMLLNGSEIHHCKARVKTFSSEIMQVVSWAITLIALYCIRKNKNKKFPWILRAWWVCSFLLHLICTSLDTYVRGANREPLQIQDYADFICLPASIFLLGISIRGKTGIVLVASNGITQPLLVEKTDKDSASKKKSSYGKATLLQLITFAWLNPLFAVGIKKPLEQNDIPDVDVKDSAEFLSRSFTGDLNKVKEKDQTTNPSIYRAILFFITKKAAINAIFAVVSASASYVGPYLINDFVSFLTEKKTQKLETGYFLALAFLGAKTVETIAQRQWIFGARQLGLRLRAALVSQIYKKGLRLSSQSRQSHNGGEIMNYVSVDIQRITDFIWYMNTIWMLPVQISLAVYVLHTNIGLGSLAALAATLTVMAFNIPLTRIQKRYQSKIMEAKDGRMKATSEVLRNMKIIKLQAWDSQFLQKLEGLRKIEYNWLWKSLRLGALSAFIFWGSPTFISVVTFGACMFMGIQLTAGRVLSALATFRMLQDPIFSLPDLLSVIAQGKVSVDRVASFLGEEEIQLDAIEFVPKDQTEYGLEIDNGKFSWDPESSSPTLHGIHLKVMQNGRIAQAGTFEELLKQNIGFEVLVGAHNEALESILAVESSSRTSQEPAYECESQIDSTSNAELLHTQHDSEHNLSLEITEKGGKLVQDEERETGSIGKEVYWSYLTTVKGGILVPIIILAQSSFQVLQIASNYWMAWATPPTSEAKPIFSMNTVLLVYILLAVGSSLCVLVRSSLVAIAGISTAQKLFTNMQKSVLRAPMAFFDSTPTGRILNRASTDQSVLDLEMANRIGWCAFSIIQILGTIAVMSQVAWAVFGIFIPVTAICIWYQQYYTPTARELARLAQIQLAPILHHFSESLSGAATIRAFDQEDRFFNANLGLIDGHSRPWFHNVSAMEWLSFRLNILSNFVFAFSLVVLVSLPEGIINPSIAGLAVTYGINLNVLQASVIWNICNAENKMISVERILQYSNIPSEAPHLIEERRPPTSWPEVGIICFKNLQIRYAEHLPSVLKNINCTFHGRKKVGVVGRTGSGKSTLIQAIFRIVEPREGSIIIDGVDICNIGLHDLRSRLSIIPQDPTMFEGTVRGNLDPLMQYSDHEVWETLDKCQLGDLVRAKEEKLDTTVIENGENWSVGQRQLFCLGRALLKKSSILVLDEATASVDSATDNVIQKIISQEFKDRTVVTIAHRIHTVIDSDFVLVLHDGRIAEYDTPAKLLEREDSFFSKLIKEYSMRSKGFNSKEKST